MDPLTLIGAIPTALNTVSSLSSLFSQPYMPPKQYQENSREVFKKGGKLRGHNNYNAPSHEQGGQLVNNQGIPDPNGTNEIEKQESSYAYTRLNKEPYVFTPEDAQKVSKLTKKYKNANTSDLEKNALELSIQRIENKNEMKKKLTNKFMYGGKIKKYYNGGGLDPFSLNPGIPPNKVIDMIGANQGLLNKDGSYGNPDSLMVSEMNKQPMMVTNYNQNPQFATGQFMADKLTDFRGTPQQLSLKDIQAPRQGAYASPKIQSGAQKYSTKTAPSSSIGVGKSASTAPQSGSDSQSGSNPLKTLDTLRNLTLAGSSLGMLRGAEKEDPIMTDYSKSRSQLNKLESNLDPMREQMAQSSNQLRNVNRNSASSYNSFANREAQRVGNLQQSLSGVTMQEQQMRNQIAGQKAQFESGVAQDNKQTLQQNRINNQQNRAATAMNKERQLQTVMSDLDRRSRRENNKNLADATREETMALMSTMYDNFDPSKPYYSALINKAMGKALTAEEEEILLSEDPINFK